MGLHIAEVRAGHSLLRDEETAGPCADAGVGADVEGSLGTPLGPVQVQNDRCTWTYYPGTCSTAAAAHTHSHTSPVPVLLSPEQVYDENGQTAEDSSRHQR